MKDAGRVLMKKKAIITTILSVFLLAVVIAAGLNAVFTVTYVNASFVTYTDAGAAAAERMKEQLNGYINSSTAFLDLGEVRATVEADPRFEVVSVEKDYPETIVVRVTERREAFAVADGTTYAILDEEGTRLDTASSPDGRVLLSGFTVTFEDGRADGAYFDAILSVFAAFREAFGEVRANVVSITMDDNGTPTLPQNHRFRIAMREGVEIVLLEPSVRAGEKAAAAAERYMSLGDLQRVHGRITVLTQNEDIVADYSDLF